MKSDQQSNDSNKFFVKATWRQLRLSMETTDMLCNQVNGDLAIAMLRLAMNRDNRTQQPNRLTAN